MLPRVGGVGEICFFVDKHGKPRNTGKTQGRRREIIFINPVPGLSSEMKSEKVIAMRLKVHSGIDLLLSKSIFKKKYFRTKSTS